MIDLEQEALVRIKIKAIDSLLSESDKLKYGLFPDGTMDDRGIENLPTDEEINTAYEAEKAKYDAQEYARNRASAYDSVGDQLDQLMKDMRDGTTTHQTACETVKAKYPKPE